MAEERLAVRRYEETEILQKSLRYEVEDIDPGQESQQQLNVARAARATVLAEKELADVQVEEAEIILRLARDAVEAADARVQLADEQLTQVLNTLLFPNAKTPPISPARTQHYGGTAYNFIPFRDAPRHPWPQLELDTSSNIDSAYATDSESCQDNLSTGLADGSARGCEVNST